MASGKPLENWQIGYILRNERRMSNRQMAMELSLSPKTVSNCLKKHKDTTK